MDEIIDRLGPDGRYHLLQPIGRGARSIVYRGLDTTLDRPVAVKLLLSDSVHDQRFILRFIREAKVTARLDHPHIIPIYDFGQTAEALFIVMKLYPRSLRQQLAEEGPWPWPRLLNLVEQLARGLDYAHQEGLIHRDIKPDNILLGRWGRPVLTDFGVVHLLDRSHLTTTTSRWLGTAPYMAPELWEGQPVSPATDIYALGCLIYEVATGQQLFEAPTQPAIMKRHLSPHTWPDTWPEGIPARLSAALEQALASDPADRQPSATALIDQLRHLNDPPPAVDPAPVSSSSASTAGPARPRFAILSQIPEIAWGKAVPAGEYTIGGDKEAYYSLLQQRILIGQSYALSRYPVTYEQFQWFVEASDFADERWWAGMPEGDELQKIAAQNWPVLDHPRENVTWYQAIAFCRWLSDKVDYKVALPHEYEWEVAARYPDGRFFPWGNTWDPSKVNTKEEGPGQTTPVGAYPAGAHEALQLYDLVGNVWEWCCNKWDDPADMAVDKSGARRVVRGGSWYDGHLFARVAYRSFFTPDNRNYSYGFRLVRRPPSHDH